MMASDRNAFKLGLTLIGFFIVFCGVLWFLAPEDRGDTLLQVRFPHERFGTVLKPGGEVLCGGKNVGSIQDLQLSTLKDPASGRDELYAVVTFLVDASLGLRRDCRIIPTEALLGGMGALVIKDRGLAEPVAAGQMLEGEPATSIADLTAALGRQLDPQNPAGLLALIQTQLDPANARSLIAKVHQSLSDVNTLTRNLAGETDVTTKAALLSKLHDILDNVNLTTAALRDQVNLKSDTTAVAKVHRVLDQLNLSLQSAQGILEENREPIRRTVAHVESTSEILEKQIAARLAQQLDASNAAGLLARIHVAIERLGHSLENVDSITGDVREVVSLNKNNIDTMIGNLKETSDHLKAGSKEIRLNPWLLLYTPKPDEVSRSQLFGTARAFSEGATRLDDAVARLESISRNPAANSPANHEEVAKIRAQLKETFEKFNQAEQKLWAQLKIQ